VGFLGPKVCARLSELEAYPTPRSLASAFFRCSTHSRLCRSLSRYFHIHTMASSQESKGLTLTVLGSGMLSFHASHTIHLTPFHALTLNASDMIHPTEQY
jgi:hypothetical protein